MNHPEAAAPGAAPFPQGRYVDRELSWLGFNQRVLDEALDERNPLLERIKFLAIVASNLDEFFEVRVAALLQKVESGVIADGIAGLDARAKLDEILRAVRRMVRRQYQSWNEEMLPRLREHGVYVHAPGSLDGEARNYLHDYFRREIYRLLTPIKVDPAHPFPWVLNKALCVVALLREEADKRREHLGVVTIPRSLPRVLSLPSKDRSCHFVFLYEVVQHFIGELFKGYTIRGASAFRVTRNSNLYLQEEEGTNLLDAVEAVVQNRRKGNAVRLEIAKDAPRRVVDALVRNFDIESDLVFRVDGPVHLNRLMGLYDQVAQPQLKYPPFTPSQAFTFRHQEDLFDAIKAQDVFLHHPFDAFDPVVRFIQAAAADPKVLAIKQTLYRTSKDSAIMYALLEAAERGKEVVVVVELKARFDEASNIQWARQLEEAGGTVLYGLVGLKTHCKMSLIARKEDGGLRQYAHVGTGNYNPVTARLYTDLSLLTANPEITDGVTEVFNFLSAQSKSPDFKSLLVGPVNFLRETLALIRRERDHAMAGLPAGITAKMNGLMDKEVIDALYEASRAGVPVRLIVRGICALRPGAKGLGENIQVRSVVGRFLEHSRIFHFENAGSPAVYLGSGDWMERNLRERVEMLLPVRNRELVRELEEILSVYWADTVKAREIRGDGGYQVLAGAAEAVNAQEWFIRRREAPDAPAPPVPSIFPPRPGRTEAGAEGPRAEAAEAGPPRAEENRLPPATATRPA